MISMTPTMRNQMTSMVGFILRDIVARGINAHGRIRPVLQLAEDQEDEQNAEQRIHPEESKQCEEAISGRDRRREAAGRAHQSVDDPRLPANLRSDPPC